MFNKRGISAIVATVLIILITVSAVGILWAAVIPMIQTALDFSSLQGRVTILNQGYTAYDSTNKIAMVQVKRDVDEGVMNRIKITFDVGGNSHSSSVVAPESGGTKVYYFDVSGVGEPDSVSVAPIFVSGKREKEGDVTSEVDIPSTTISEVGAIVYEVGEDYFGDMSCLDILNFGSSVGDGVYTIDPDGSGGEDPFEVYCDMTTDGGGWTLIASYVDGTFFNDCSDMGMEYGSSCYSVCSEITGEVRNCETVEEKAKQDSELEKLEKKYVIDESFGSLDRRLDDDYVSPSYYSLSFKESMFGDDDNDFISYDFSSYVATSMRDFYNNENTKHLELIIPSSKSSLDSSINSCDTFEFATMIADSDGGALPYSAYKYSRWSPAFSGPGWASSNNGGCYYDDGMSRWQLKKLGGQNNDVSAYILWFVR